MFELQKEQTLILDYLKDNDMFRKTDHSPRFHFDVIYVLFVFNIFFKQNQSYYVHNLHAYIFAKFS